jgi:hypothetical protein
LAGFRQGHETGLGYLPLALGASGVLVASGVNSTKASYRPVWSATAFSGRAIVRHLCVGAVKRLRLDLN